MDYTTANGECKGHSYHTVGTSKDVIAMLRRVNDMYHYADPAVRATLSMLAGTIAPFGNDGVKGQLTVRFADKAPASASSRQVPHPVEPAKKEVPVYEIIHTSTQVVKAAEPPKEQPRESEYHSTSIQPHGEETQYHGTHISPHGEETNYHGTNIQPHGEETNYHGTHISPHGEETRYHGTNIQPHGEETDYHGTQIRPHREEREDTIQESAPFEQEYKEPTAFDISQYLGQTQPMYYYQEEVKPVQQYKSFKQQRYEQLHKRPEKKVTWDEIRRRNLCVCLINNPYSTIKVLVIEWW